MWKEILDSFGKLGKRKRKVKLISWLSVKASKKKKKNRNTLKTEKENCLEQTVIALCWIERFSQIFHCKITTKRNLMKESRESAFLSCFLQCPFFEINLHLSEWNKDVFWHSKILFQWRKGKGIQGMNFNSEREKDKNIPQYSLHWKYLKTTRISAQNTLAIMCFYT